MSDDLQETVDIYLSAIAYDTLYLSSPTVRRNHPAFHRLLDLGTDITQHMLNRLLRQGRKNHPWVALSWLFTVHGERGPTIPEEDNGRLVRLIQHWRAWAREHGYTLPPMVEWTPPYPMKPGEGFSEIDVKSAIGDVPEGRFFLYQPNIAVEWNEDGPLPGGEQPGDPNIWVLYDKVESRTYRIMAEGGWDHGEDLAEHQIDTIMERDWEEIHGGP